MNKKGRHTKSLLKVFFLKIWGEVRKEPKFCLWDWNQCNSRLELKYIKS